MHVGTWVNSNGGNMCLRFKVGDRAALKLLFIGKNRFASGEIVRIAKHPTMYKIEIYNPTNPHRYEWALEKELSHIITICA